MKPTYPRRRPARMTAAPRARQMKQNNGKLLESMLLKTNEMYKLQRRALVIKQHPEVKTMRDYKGKINETIYSERSGLDYAGLIKGGQYITFEAKQVKELTRFPFDYIKPHQIETLRETEAMGGHAFFIIYFISIDMAYLVKPETIINPFLHYRSRKRTNERLKPGEASLSLDTIRKEGFPIIEGQGVFLNWMGAYEAAFGTDA